MPPAHIQILPPSPRDFPFPFTAHVKWAFPSSRRMANFHVYEKSKGRQAKIWGGETPSLTYMTPASCQAASTFFFFFSSWPPSQRLWAPFSAPPASGQLFSAPPERPGPRRRGRLAEAALTINQAPRDGGLALVEAEGGGESQANWSRAQQTYGWAAVSLSSVRERRPCPSVYALAPPLVLPRPSLSPRPFFSQCGAAGAWHSALCAPRGAPSGRGGETNPETTPPLPAEMRLPLGGGGGS